MPTHRRLGMTLISTRHTSVTKPDHLWRSAQKEPELACEFVSERPSRQGVAAEDHWRCAILTSMTSTLPLPTDYPLATLWQLGGCKAKQRSPLANTRVRDTVSNNSARLTGVFHPTIGLPTPTQGQVCDQRNRRPVRGFLLSLSICHSFAAGCSNTRFRLNDNKTCSRQLPSNWVFVGR
jgi:hypothetical protein